MILLKDLDYSVSASFVLERLKLDAQALIMGLLIDFFTFFI
ncbi:hypothetical protein QIA01_04925 (plasmid) [Borreliella americana]